MVICLERGADLHMSQLSPLPLTVSCFRKIQVGFTFLVLAHRPTRAVPDKGPLNGCVCMCVHLPVTTAHCCFTGWSLSYTLLLNCVPAEQSTTEHKSRDVYASKLDQARESASTLTWLNILGNLTLLTRSTQPCIPPGSFNRVPASAGVRAGMSPLPGGR